MASSRIGAAGRVSRVVSRAYAMTLRAAQSMSSRDWRSRFGIEQLRFGQDGGGAAVAFLQGAAVEQVHLASEQVLQFVFHVNAVEQAPVRFGRITGDQVHVAVGTEVDAQDRAEDFEPGNAPPPAKPGD